MTTKAFCERAEAGAQADILSYTRFYELASTAVKRIRSAAGAKLHVGCFPLIEDRTILEPIVNENRQVTNSMSHAWLNARWLLQLRWVAVIGQLIAIAIVIVVLQIPLFLFPLLIVIAATAISNVLLGKWIETHEATATTPEGNRRFEICMALVSTMDLLSLTALLYVTGGASNPFFIFYFVNLALSAIVLPRNWVWGLNLLAIVAFIFISYDHYPVERLAEALDIHPARWSGVWTLRQIALIIAFAGCSSVIVYFLTRLMAALRQHEADLREAQRLKAASDKLEALGTLAAGAAHELATPLSTIAVVAREVEKTIETKPAAAGDPDLADDIHLIRRELDRCRTILDRMSIGAGQAIAESFQRVTWDRVRSETLAGLHESQRVDWRADCDELSESLPIPLIGFSQALRGLIQNALDASAAGQRVWVVIEHATPLQWKMTIRDQGQGMPAEIAIRAGQPFFTTKSPGKGMGLGVFLADNLIRRLGGKMEIRSAVGAGTTVTIYLPKERK